MEIDVYKTNYKNVERMYARDINVCRSNGNVHCKITTM